MADPLNIGGGGVIACDLWLDAADGSTIHATNGLVDTWDDKSAGPSHSATATTTQRPTTGQRNLNGHNVLDFDGVANKITSSAYSRTTPITLGMVFQNDDGADSTQQIVITDTTTGSFFGKSTANAYQYSSGNGNQIGTVDANLHIAVVTFSSTVGLVQVDGVILSSGQNSGTATWGGGTIIGASNAGTKFWDGGIAEIICYSTAFTAAQRAIFQNYLYYKWVASPIIVTTPPPAFWTPLDIKLPPFPATAPVSGVSKTFECIFDLGRNNAKASTVLGGKNLIAKVPTSAKTTLTQFKKASRLVAKSSTADNTTAVVRETKRIVVKAATSDGATVSGFAGTKVLNAKGSLADRAMATTFVLSGTVSFSTIVSETKNARLSRTPSVTRIPLARTYQAKVASSSRLKGVLNLTPRNIAKIGSSSSFKARLSYKRSIVAKASLAHKAKATMDTTSTAQGNQPAIPADIIQAVPASRFTMAGGAYGIFNANSRGTTNDFATWKGWGVGGHVFALGGVGKMNTQLGMGSTAASQGSSNYDWQIAQEGLGVPAINGGARGTPFANVDYGPKLAKAKYPAEWKFYLGSPKLYRLGGDWFDDAAWAVQVTKMGNLAAMIKFFGASGFYWDTEDLNVPAGAGLTWASPDNPNFTHQQNIDKCEQRGYEIGKAIYAACPGLEIIIYDPVPAGSWYADNVYGGGFNTSSNLGNNKMMFQFGIMRAGAELGTAGHWAHLDHRLGYYMSPGVSGASYETAAKWSIMGMMSRFSRELPAASRDYWMDKLDYRWFSWSSNTQVSGYAQVQQLNPTEIVQSWRAGRKWSMGGEFSEFETTNNCPTSGMGDGRPDGCGGPPSIYWNGKQVYHSDAGVIAGLLEISSTVKNIDSSPFTIGTIGQSRSGNTLTLTCTAAHKMGMRYVSWKLYASNGTSLLSKGQSVMNWSLNGANTQTTIDNFNPYMICTMTIPNVASGAYIILDFCSAKDQHTYRRVQAI